MGRRMKFLLGLAACVVLTQIARADFLIEPAQIVHNDGSLAVQITGGPPPFTHESTDTFALSADAQRIYLFENDLGSITVESWSATTGAYLGAVGPHYPSPSSSQPWPNNFQPNYAIGEVHTRSTFPSFGGDLFYVGPIGPTLNSSKPVINAINTTTHQFVEQIVPPAAVTKIFDFAMGPGALGPKSRVYASTNAGLFRFDETADTPFIDFDPVTFDPIFDLTHFQLASTHTASQHLKPNCILRCRARRISVRSRWCRIGIRH